MPPPELSKIQRRFWRYLTHPTGVATAVAVIGADDEAAAPVSRWIAIDEESVAVERLDVYANMYFFRLRDILAEDFECVHRAIGADQFHNLVTDYLIDHAPNDPNIRNVGARFAAFIESTPLMQTWPWLASLARFEWNRIDVFDRADATLLAQEHLADLAPEAWPTLTLELIPALSIVQLEYAAHELWTSIRDGEAPSRTDPAPTALVIWRRGFRVYHRTVDPPELEALDAIANGHPFATVCERLMAGDDDIAGAAQAARTKLLRWMADGLLRGAPNKETQK